MKKLNEIIQQYNYSESFPIFGNELVISPQRNVYTQLRTKYKSLADEGFLKFQRVFDNLRNIDELLSSAYKALSVAIEDSIMEVVNDSISVGVNVIDTNNVYDECERLCIFDDFNRAYRTFAVEDERIISNLNNASYYRKMRKECRPRWTSATIGGNMAQAWGNKFQAAQMNAIEGMGHDIANAVGNAWDEAKADDKRKALFNDKQKRKALLDGAYSAIFDVMLVLTNSLNKAAKLKLGGFVSKTDSANARSIFNNLTTVSLTFNQQKEFAYKILTLDPYVYEYYLTFLLISSDNYQEILNIAKFFGITPSQDDLSDVVYKTLSCNLGNDLDGLVKNREDVLKNAASLGLEVKDADKNIVLISETAASYLNTLVSNKLNNEFLDLENADGIIKLKENIESYSNKLSLSSKYNSGAYNALNKAISNNLNNLANGLSKNKNKGDEKSPDRIKACEEETVNLKNRILEYAQKCSLDESVYSASIKTIEKRRGQLDRAYRSVGSHTYNSREEADKARTDIDSNKEILKTEEKFTYKQEYINHIDKIRKLNIDNHVKEDYIKRYSWQLKDFEAKCQKAKRFLWRKNHNNNRFWNGDLENMMLKYGFVFGFFMISAICFITSHWFIGLILFTMIGIPVIGIINIEPEKKAWEEITQGGKLSIEEVLGEAKCICPNCGTQNRPSSQFCVSCGGALKKSQQ